MLFSCFSTIGCPKKTLPEVLSLADRYQIPFVEIRTLEGREDLPSLFKERFGSPSEVERILSLHRAQPLVWGTSLSLIDHAKIDGMDELIPWLKPYRWLRIFDGGKKCQPLTNEDIIRSREYLKKAQNRLQLAGLKTQILVETHGAFCDPQMCRRFLDSADMEINLLWDTHHTWRQGQTPTARTWELLGPWVRHIHIKDSRRDPDQTTEAFRYTTPEEGEFDFLELRSLLRQSQYRGVVSLEWEKRWHPELPEVEKVFRSFSFSKPD